MDDEYYYDDEGTGYDDAVTEEDVWERAMENKYAAAKALIGSDPVAATVALEEIMAEDVAAAKWKFKALRMLVRASMKAERYDDMVSYFQQVLAFTFPGLTKVMLQKAMMKTVDHAVRIPPEKLDRVVDVAVGAAEKDLESLGRQWLMLKLRVVRRLIDRGELRSTFEHLWQMQQWCYDSDPMLLRCGSLLHSAYSMEMEVYGELHDYYRLGQLLEKVHRVPQIIQTPHAAGLVKHFSGIVHAHQGDLARACDAFSAAFRTFNDCGDPYRITSFKYHVFTSIFVSCVADPLVTSEARALEAHPDVIAVVTLRNEHTRSNVQGFLDAVSSPLHRAALHDDYFIKQYLERAAFEVRLAALLKYTGPYRRVLLSRLAAKLCLDVKATERMCVRCIADGRLAASVDEIQQTLALDNVHEGLNKERYEGLSRWSEALLHIQESTGRRAQFL